MKPRLVMIALSSLLACSASAFAQDAIPVGTILPARLDSTLSLNAKPGKTITARVMQNIPPSNQTRIREGARVIGHIISVGPANTSAPSQITFTFDRLVFDGHTIPITASLRAIASFVEVEQAQIPETGPDRGTPESAWTTRQVGGDSVYRGGGPVVEGAKIVGEPTYDGVLARLRPVSGSKCTDAINTLQALWVFSADACGTYGFTGPAIAHAGRSKPSGEITLASAKSKLNIPSGSGMLLQIMSDGGRNAS